MAIRADMESWLKSSRGAIKGDEGFASVHHSFGRGADRGCIFGSRNDDIIACVEQVLDIGSLAANVPIGHIEGPDKIEALGGSNLRTIAGHIILPGFKQDRIISVEGKTDFTGLQRLGC